MISQIPSLQTNVIATVRRDAQQSVGSSATQQQTYKQDEPAFSLNAAARDIPASENDNYAGSSINLSAVNTNQQSASPTGKSARSYASTAYSMAHAFSAYAPYRAVSFTI